MAICFNYTFIIIDLLIPLFNHSRIVEFCRWAQAASAGGRPMAGDATRSGTGARPWLGCAPRA